MYCELRSRTATTAADEDSRQGIRQLLETPEEGREAWKNKLFIYTGAILRAGQKYRISMNVKSIIPAPFEVCFNNYDIEKGLGGIFGLISKPSGTYVEYTTYLKEDSLVVISFRWATAPPRTPSSSAT